MFRLLYLNLISVTQFRVKIHDVYASHLYVTRMA